MYRLSNSGALVANKHFVEIMAQQKLNIYEKSQIAGLNYQIGPHLIAILKAEET